MKTKTVFTRTCNGSPGSDTNDTKQQQKQNAAVFLPHYYTTMGFLDNVFGDNNNQKNDKKKKDSNPLANALGRFQNKPSTFQGAGQSLGGSKPGQVISIVLPNAGPLGVRIEKKSNSSASAIVNQVVEGSQAEAAGLQRGDILCFAGSNGQEEIEYDLFLQLVKSGERPIRKYKKKRRNVL